jgi:hypothetical protein
MHAQNSSQTSVPMPGDHIHGRFCLSASGWIRRRTFSANVGSADGRAAPSPFSISLMCALNRWRAE